MGEKELAAVWKEVLILKRMLFSIGTYVHALQQTFNATPGFREVIAKHEQAVLAKSARIHAREVQTIERTIRRLESS